MGSRRLSFVAGVLGALALLTALTLLTARRAAADEPFTEEVAKRLLPDAGALDRPEVYNVIQSLGRRVTAADLREAEAFALPYVAAIVAQQRSPAGAENDFRIDPAATPTDYGAALSGGKPLAAPLRSTTGLTLLRPEYLKRVTVKQSGPRARGEVEFEAPRVYRGHLVFEALLAAGSWHITAFEFPITGAKIKWSWGQWVEGRMPEERPPVLLPVVSAAAPLPDSSSSIVIGVSARAIWVGGQEQTTFQEAQQSIVARAQAKGREPDGSSRADAVIYADEEASWTAIQWVLQMLASERAGVWKIHFAATHRSSRETGAIATSLPKDRSIGPTPTLVAAAPVKVGVFSRGEDHPTAPEVVPQPLFDNLRQMHAAAPNAHFEIDVPPPFGRRVRYGIVLRLIDAAKQAGFARVDFVGAAMPVPRGAGGAPAVELAQALADLAALPHGNVVLKLGGKMFPASWPPAAIPDGPPPSEQARLGVASDGMGDEAEPPPEEDLPPTPEETEMVHESDIVAREPTVKDAEISDHDETDKDLPTEEKLGDAGIADAPFKGPSVGGPFKGRAGHGSLRGGGGGKPADQAVEDALRWLAAHQAPNGGWECEGFGKWCDGKTVAESRPDGAGKATYDVGVTGLALLAYLGAGYTNRSDGPFGKVVANGLRYLRNSQDAEGCVGSRVSAHYNYNHAIAATALVEAFGMTGSTLYKRAAQKALDFVAISRNPYFAWRYGVRPGDNDTSVTGWMLMALEAAKWVNAADAKAGQPASFALDEDAFDGIRAWIDKMTDPDYGRVGYQQRGTGPARPTELVDKFPADKSESMTAIGILARIYLGENPRTSDPIKKGADLCAKLLPNWDPNNGSIDMDYWHFATLAMFQVGGEPWTKWEAAMKAAIVDTQRKDTDFCQFKGSWDPLDPWGPDGGRVYSTAMMAASLEAATRYPRVFQPPALPPTPPARTPAPTGK